MHKQWRLNALRGVSVVFLGYATGTFGLAMAGSNPEAILRAKYISLEPQLRQNQFKRPLVLDSIESSNRLQGDIYALVDYSFSKVNAGLNNPSHWCDVMLLHINTKYCHAIAGPTGTILKVNIGKKTPEELSDVPRLEFNYNVAVATREYLDIILNASVGPFGTRNYLVRLEAVALPGDKTFLHLTYSYAFNFTGSLAMQTYLGTIGSDKVGFTIIGRRVDGQPNYIRGVRGLVERNTMRYYLAIDSFLGAASAPPAMQFEMRLQNWFTAAEHFPRQLHEMNQETYLEMKRAENIRQQTLH